MRIACAALALLVACSGGPTTVVVRFETAGGRVAFAAEVADEPAEQQRGLMGRESLASDAGMLFLWGVASARSFHMLDTLIPLDLVAIRDGRVVSVHTMQPCRAAPCPLTKTAPADAALEINAGLASRNRIVVGTLVAAPGIA